MLLLIGFASAIDMDDACSSRGYSNTISSFIFNDGYVNVNGSGVDVVGNSRKLNWTSEVFIEAVVYKSGSRTYLSDGGFNGTIPKTTLSNDITFVNFCSSNYVPEFSLIGTMIIIFMGIGIIIYRRR
jgi:hypothetical protein